MYQVGDKLRITEEWLTYSKVHETGLFRLNLDEPMVVDKVVSDGIVIKQTGLITWTDRPDLLEKLDA